jgi:aminoglycoside phosphotransferase (APT) family kinase protein
MIEHVATEMARSEFGTVPDTVEQIADGLIHQTYLVAYGDEEYVIQVSDVDEERERALERGATAYAVARDAGVPVPKLVSDHVQLFEDNEQGRKYYVAAKIPGTSLRASFRPGLATTAGRTLADIHGVRQFAEAGWLVPAEDGFSVEPFPEGSLKDWIISTVQEDTATLAEHGMEDAATQVRRLFDRYGDTLPGGDEFQPVFCHNDYSPDNIFADKGEITGILDFDYAYAGHNQRDLVKAANAFWLEGHDVRTELYEGYREAGDLNASFEHNEPLYRVETLNRIIASIVELRDDVGEDERETYRRMVAETVQYAEETLTESQENGG